MDEFVREFLVESYENLDQLDQDLVALEGRPGSPELLSRVFRTIHTIKGTCGFLAFGRLESLTHAGENLLDELREGQREMNQPTTDALLHMVDTIREILASIESFGTEGDIAVDGVVEQIRAILQEPARPVAMEAATLEEPPRPAALEIDASAGAAGPIASELVTSEPLTPETFLDIPMPVAVSESAIRVDVEVLDALMRQVGELVLARNQITRLVGGQLDAELVRASQRLSLVVSQLQEGVKQARMQPIGRMWAQMPRVVRDLEVVCGRQVRLRVIGGDTELDRALVGAVKDPLMHLVRNAVDHGIEDAQTRVASGKPAEGVLTIRAYHAGGRVVVEVQDDGQGIDADHVGAVALARGRCTRAQLAAMSESDVLQLLFLPGFSMAEKVTHVSGRGVGLDVVQSNIMAIGGTVEVESTLGVGTTWRLRIPLTLAIISALIVESGGERYSIPSANVLEFVAPDTQVAPAQKSAGATIEYVGSAPVLRLRGRLLPLVRLADLLGTRGSLLPDGPTVVAVLEADRRRFGLVVTRVLDTEEIVVMPLPARLRGVGVYAGTTSLGDGRVSLILDVQGIARQALNSRNIEVDPLPGTVTSLPVAETRQVLVVGTGGGQRVAILLADVTRLERFQRDVVEQVGGREVLQYRGRIVPLTRLDRLLGRGVDPAVRADPAAGELGPQELLVVMFAHGTHHVAVVVEEVLDIVDDDLGTALDDRGGVRTVVLADKVTELLDVREVVLAADPFFFDDDVAGGIATSNLTRPALRAVGA